MALKGTFLTSPLARRLFLAVFCVTSLALLCVGGLFYKLGEMVIHTAASRILIESGKSTGRTLVNHLVGAQRLMLQVQAMLPAGFVDGDLPLSPASREVFNWIRLEDSSEAATAWTDNGPGLSSRLETVGGLNRPTTLVLHLAPRGNTPGLKAEVNPAYLWDEADSALFSYCVQVDELVSTYCSAGAGPSPDAFSVSHAINFQPQFEGKPWHLTLTGSPELSQVVPLNLGAVAAVVSALAFLLALIGTSVYLRRLTRSLDGLMRITRNAGAGDFTQRVPLNTLKDEMRELGDAFNRMMARLEENFSFNSTLSRIDAAVLARMPLESTLALVLGSARDQLPKFQCRIVAMSGAAPSVYVLDGLGELTITPPEVATGGSAFEQHNFLQRISIGTIRGQESYLEVFSEAPDQAGMESAQGAKLSDLGNRLKIAVEAASHEKLLKTQATTDSLTGLLNRFGFVQQLQALIEDAAWDKQIAIVFCDLDKFKDVNDVYGHTVGDALLSDIAQRITNELTALPHRLARLGGDEFALLLPADAAPAMLDQLGQMMRLPVKISGRELKISSSIGLAVYPRDGTDTADLLRKADLAMYRAKAQGGSTWRAFHPHMDEDTFARLDMLEHLRAATAAGALRVVYQPRVTAGSHVMVSAEALIRWQHPNLGWVSPAKFIPLAEEFGLIDAIGIWILEQTCAQLQSWRNRGFEIDHISVNVSPIQFESEAFFEKAPNLLKLYQLPAGAIELEITEGALVKNVASTVHKLRQLREAGFRIALDDFGVGYSSLSYLRDIPFDTLKIDQSFVSEMHTSEVARAIAVAIVALAKALNKRIVAEGVELEAQSDWLEKIGANELQGYLFSKPVAPEMIETMLQAEVKRPMI
nr:EAL domain-containing protein [uncultured Albidiferax sp.]